jgi:putative colanic acid biosynthesis acetyltransferase WcaF
LLRIFGAEIAPTAIVYGSTKVWLPSNLKMEEFSCLGPRVICYDMAQITVQSHATVSQGSHLCAGTHDINTASFPLVVKPIIIGSHAWIAAEAFVGPGVHVGNYCVLGARAVAFHNLEEKGVYIGNPAVLKKSRQSFDEASRK